MKIDIKIQKKVPRCDQKPYIDRKRQKLKYGFKISQ